MKILVVFFCILFNVTLAWRGYKVIMEQLTVRESNDDYVRNVTVGMNQGIASFFMHLKKDIGLPTRIQFVAFQKRKGKYDTKILNITEDLCKYFKNHKTSPILDAIYPTLMNKGNFPKNCPIKTGAYIINDMKIDSERLPPYLPGEYWKVFLILMDVNVMIYNIETIIKIDHSPGKDKFGSVLN